MTTQRWWMGAAAFGMLAGACSGGDDSGKEQDLGMVAPPTGQVMAGSMAMNVAGSGAVMTMVPPNTMMAGSSASTAGSGAPMTAGTGAPMTAGTGAPMTAGSGGSGAMMPVDPSSCPPAPEGSSQGAIEALAAINGARVAAGAGCVNMVAAINDAAQAHCEYYSMYGRGDMCTANPHNEVMSCAGFTGEGPGDRMRAAGYDSRWGGGEVMAFLNDPQGSVDTWINSVWHRIPMLDPWTMDMGYGATDGCDTMDFGASGDAPEDTVLLWPYDGQTGVVPSFNGMYEGPMPPPPPTGWPSAMPITLYGRDLNITEHVITKDGDPTPLEHTWITGDDPMWGNYLRTSVFAYVHTPFEPNTKYHVVMKGTYVGGALEREWSFTTGENPRWGRP